MMNNDAIRVTIATEHTSAFESTFRNSQTTRYLLRIAHCHGDENRRSRDTHPPDREITNNERVLTSLAAGALAGAVAKSTIAPLDRTKIYFQTTPSTSFNFQNVIGFLYKSYKTAGFASLWRGNSATLVRIIPYSAIQFTAHEQFKVLLKVDSPKTNEFTRFCCGSLAGVVAQSLTYPLDLTRARLAVSPISEYNTLLDVFKKTLKFEGPLGLYKGITPTILGVIPYAGCSFYCYESLKRLWTKEFGPTSVGAFERLCFGALSGIIGQSCSYPLDIVRRRMQTRVHSSEGTLGVIRMLSIIARNEGIIRGWFKGLSMNWIKGPIAAGISFSMFDFCNIFLRTWIVKR